ncbi:carotenoid oxygenase [Auricularia subglabra TFB-10046 SS5]|nr:carotenoid oxygenase [Auricularia subglabra TFB-10046 SS5]
MYEAAFQNAVEQRTPVELTIEGTIPDWLNGDLYRAGPGTYTIARKDGPPVQMQHWFDGVAMNHRFSIQPGGRVLYSSRKAGEAFEEHVSQGGKLGVTFAQRDPCKKLFSKFFTIFSGNEARMPPSVTITPDMPGFAGSVPAKHGVPEDGRPHYLVVKTDASVLQILDADSLDPLDMKTYKDIDPQLDGQLSAAHACRDDTGFYNYSLKLGPSPSYKTFRIAPDGTVTVLATITDAPASYLHSFALTQKYLILTIWQAHFKSNGLPVLLNKNIIDGIEREWKPRTDSLIYVVDRVNGGLVAKYKTAAFFTFHHLNAYDDGDDALLDLIVYDNHSPIEGLYVHNICNQKKETELNPGNVRRYRLKNISSGQRGSIARKADIDWTGSLSNGMELATIRPQLKYKPYRFAYGVNKENAGSLTFFDRVIKFDVSKPDGPHVFWSAPKFTPSEPIFVPRPGSTEEDDGVVLSVVLDVTNVRSMLVILDARDMSELARAVMQYPFPIGFHGVYTPRTS